MLCLSPEVERRITLFSATGAARHWRGMQAASPREARGALAWLLRRRWAMTALRENARLKLERMEFVGRGAPAAADRRQAAMGEASTLFRRSACRFWQGPQLSRAYGDT